MGGVLYVPLKYDGSEWCVLDEGIEEARSILFRYIVASDSSSTALSS